MIYLSNFHNENEAYITILGYIYLKIFLYAYAYKEILYMNFPFFTKKAMQVFVFNMISPSQKSPKFPLKFPHAKSKRLA